MLTQTIEIQVNNPGLIPQINAIQADSGRTLDCIISDMAIPAGATARIYAQKPSGAKVFNNCAISDRTVSVDLTTQILAELGRTVCQVQITQGTEKVTSFDFIINVMKSRIDSTAIESTDEFTALDEALAQADALLDNLSNQPITFTKATTVSELESGDTIAELFGQLKKNIEDGLGYSNAGSHNSIYRGKSLGTAVTADQYEAISSGTFNDLYIGDYWTINGVVYRIAAFDYYLNNGDTATTAHHAVIVPDKCMYTHNMNDTNTTAGGYVGSKMYTEGLEQAKTTIKAAFSGHVLKHRIYLTNAVTDGRPSAVAWCDSEVDLMSEQMVYGGPIFMAMSNGSTYYANYRVEKSQLPLFALNPSLIHTRQSSYWLRDVCTASMFACVRANGVASASGASSAFGGRPAFCIS